tara:strand:- start:213 stop:560 length:348 start_codon:yes stop_codon:yes gene_type:complete
MPIAITFTNNLNVSCQVGDTAYYVSTTASGGFNINSSSVVEIGIISAINNTTNTVTVANNLIASVPSGAFILFSKDNKANLSSILGYFAEVKMVNNSTTEAELFSVGVDMFESSK